MCYNGMEELLDISGLDKAVYEIKPINYSEKYKELTERKNAIIGVSKLRLGAGAIIILDYAKADKEVIYFKSISNSLLFYRNLRRLIREA